MLTLKLNRMEFSWSEFLAGSSIAAIVTEAIKYYRKKNEAKFNLVDNMNDITHVHESMEYVVDHTVFDRMMIFCGQDSAGILAAGKKLYISAQYEKFYRHNEKMQSIASMIQRWEADTEYYKMFSRILQGEIYKIKVPDMPDCKLKDIYTSQGVKYSEIGHLMTTNDNSLVFYYSMASSSDDKTNADDRMIADSQLSIIKNVFEKHKKFY